MGCEDVSGGACSEQTDRIAARHPGATRIDIRCTVATCDRRGGSGIAEITLAGGATVHEPFAYVGDLTPLPAPTCTGVPRDPCLGLARDQVEQVPPSQRITGLEVVCTASGSCAADHGVATVTVTLADGTEMESGSAWEGAQP